MTARDAAVLAWQRTVDQAWNQLQLASGNVAQWPEVRGLLIVSAWWEPE
ncbi:MAG TPA: hypothetical protein VGN81_28490 [Pseudonocardiaceae bacterium]|jgi:hypothetical protein